ncbi:adenosylmethionine-8-amino-7-oxononanoate aminotransferase [Hahella chejuensis KCTC 2396]|uniref:Adenosylmethionine-8-amino-7-oxononanoate aminotransferase n=1 Tax=Hahella chejuensis (strain KCTC 2396) TaxID=349521 RepID=Q2SLT7_HAHCH|nr:adenosylmethionine--8-amino-7-oxononanoate transaminase [Hahella chejuensis]ABC28387.1 adenosylmethionine-8-amino-7-oxononanoate aminotransferase [Hahella chejuensis KCTC 2396]
MTTNAELRERDLKRVWHPCTQMKDHEFLPLIPIKSGKGVWLEDFDGNRYIDAVSSWWVNLFGHSHPYINDAIKSQIEQLEHVILAGFTHEPVVRLSERLAEVTPAGLNKCFYADNGSSAVEVALKMSFHYWRNSGQPNKTRFINLSNSYHGETLGALAVGDVALYKETYNALLKPVINVPGPDCFHREAGESWEAYCRRQFAHMEETLQKHAHETAAVIIEPLVQCAGSMRMHHPVYLKLLREACDRHGVHLIADEIAVGFGRTGTMFACEQADISPDFLCLSKGLTAGYLPLSVVMTHDFIYDAFYDDYATMRAFLHSHSYTGNPIGCSVALATLDLFQNQPVIEQNKQLAACMREHTAHFEDHPNVAEVRQTGMILAIEMVQDKASRAPFPWQERRGIRVYEHALKNQALLRPLGNVIYFMPPYVISEDEIAHLAKVAWDGLQLAVKD